MMSKYWAGLTTDEERCVDAWTTMIDAKLEVKKSGKGYKYTVESWDFEETFSKPELIENAKYTIYEWAKGDGVEFITEITDLTEDEVKQVVAEMEVVA